MCGGHWSRKRLVPNDSDTGGCRGFGSQSGFPHEASDIECAGKDIAEILSLGAVGLAEPGRAFQVATGLVGVATFGIAETTDAKLFRK